MDRLEKTDRAVFRAAAIEALKEIAEQHDITSTDRAKVADKQQTALNAVEDWLYAAYRVNHC